jgi:hypothetical protein
MKRTTIKPQLIIFLAFLLSGCSVPVIHDAVREDRLPQIFPDYTDMIIPPNLAPLNFEIKEDGEKFLAKINGKKGGDIVLYQSNPAIKIPEKKWKSLLESNRNGSISIQVSVRKNNEWHQYQTIKNQVAEEKIDSYLYYRDIVPTNSLWNKMAMHQRDLESFGEYELFNNYRAEHNCMNCHTFNRNNPNEMLFHVRGNHGGTIIYKDGKLRKIEFPVPKILSAGAYCNWHPSGKLIAFAVNKIRQNYYLSGYGDKLKEVYDLESDIVLYDTEKNTVFTFPQIASEMRENLPCWSADGKTMYFVTALPYVVNMPNEENLYSLMQISYDMDTHQPGEPQTLISSEEINGSISFPTVSPDGRYMFFCRADFGYFPVNNKSADLYLMDLQTKQYCKPPINSDESESYISWSGNSRWFVFSSRRLDGLTSKPFICHIDEKGNISKPFIIPQEDPAYYTIDHRNFSRPELIQDKVNLDFNDLEDVIFSNAITAQQVKPAH